MKSLPKQPVEVWGGMECTVNRVGNEYFDQLDYTGHRERRDDHRLFAGLGLKKMRYPVLWEHHQPVSNQQINWAATEEKLNTLRSNNIAVIAGLVHHGSGPAFVGIADDSFVKGLAGYASEVANKFPWIKYFTPVNEPLTTARFCGLYGLWHPHAQNDACFCRILINECKATVLAMQAIRAVNPNAQLIQTDDLAKVHSTPLLAYQAEFENQRRWLSFDLLCGHVDVNHPLWSYLTENGITIAELGYFCEQPCPPDILGINYYLTSERYLDEAKENYPEHTYGCNGKHSYADVEAVRVGTVRSDGIQELLQEAWDRYGIPIAVTEVHLHCTREEQMRWLNESWLTANTLRNNGIPIVAITAWALLGSFGWNHLLTRPRGTYEPGVFDCSNGLPRPTILAAMISAFSRNAAFKHPVLDHPGWWQRSSRVLYGHCGDRSSVKQAETLLAIGGIHHLALAGICRQRCLGFVKAGDPVLAGKKIWATIVVNEYMEVSCVGRKDLVITLTGDLDHCLNAGLDLFLDGESGFWAVNADGALSKQITPAFYNTTFLES